MLALIDLMRQGAVVPGLRRSGVWAWWYEGADWPYATLHYEADLRNIQSAWVRLQHDTDHVPRHYYVWLTRTKPNYGGLRWWFCCPMLGTRVAKLYLPPGMETFASRAAYGLTYESSQKSGRRDRLTRQIARNIGWDEDLVRKSLR